MKQLWDHFKTTPAELVPQSPGPSGMGRAQNRSLGPGVRHWWHSGLRGLEQGWTVTIRRHRLSLEQLKDTISKRPQSEDSTSQVEFQILATPLVSAVGAGPVLMWLCDTKSCLESWLWPDVPKEGPVARAELLRSSRHATNRKPVLHALNTHLRVLAPSHFAFLYPRKHRLLSEVCTTSAAKPLENQD